jgi:hypothetical protein
MSRSTDDSAPVFNSVVIASVAIDRFESVIKFSQIEIARGDGRRVRDRHLIQRPDGGESQRRLRRAAEQLEHADRGGQLATSRPLQIDDGVSGFVHHHFGLVPQARLDELELGESLLESSSSRSLAVMRINMQTAYGDFSDILVNFATSLVTARRSVLRM